MSRITQKAAPDLSWTGTTLAARFALGLEIPLWRALLIRLLWEAGAQVARIDGELAAKPDARASLGLGFAF